MQMWKTLICWKPRWTSSRPGNPYLSTGCPCLSYASMVKRKKNCSVWLPTRSCVWFSTMAITLKLGDSVQWRWVAVQIADVQAWNFNLISFSGMEHQLGDETYDDPIRWWPKCHFQLSLCRLQSRPWVYRGIHFPFYEEQRRQSVSQWRHVPQINRRMVLRTG